MKNVLLFCFILTFTTMSGQIQKTFLYEITLHNQFKHTSLWGEREHQIQKAHLAYLDSLTLSGKLEIAGIVDQNLEHHTGLVILRTNSYEEAERIVLNDPSIKNGMMSVRLRPLNIYFRKE